jgi:hypothetical protein
MKTTIRLIVTALFAFHGMAFCEMPPRLAVIELDGTNTPPLQVALVSHIIRNAFVNTGLFVVLDRENMDKILKEQSLEKFGLFTGEDAAQVGRILNVNKIVMGSIFSIQSGFFMEIRIVDVNTSHIEKSKTQQCSDESILESCAQSLVYELCQIPCANSPSLSADSENESANSIDSTTKTYRDSLQKSQSILNHWQKSGFSQWDYERFMESGISESAWIKKEHRIPMLASTIGVFTGTSGFFYLHNYGTAALITLAKLMGVVGVVRSLEPETGDRQRVWLFAGCFGMASVIDAVASYTSAKNYNEKLDKFIPVNTELSLNDTCAAVTFTFTF